MAKSTSFGAYPAALIPGQYQNFFKMFVKSTISIFYGILYLPRHFRHTATELAGLPLKTVVNVDRFVTKETILDFEGSLEKDMVRLAYSSDTVLIPAYSALKYF